MNIEKTEVFVDQRYDRQKHRMIIAMMSKRSKNTGKVVDTLGRRVRDLRQAYEWGQEEVAERMAKITGTRVGQGYISDVERGRANPNWKTIATLAKVLETTADYLVMLTDNPAGPQDEKKDEHWSEEANEAGKVIDGLPDNWRVIALEEVKKVDAEWKEIQRQDKELSTWLDRVEAAGGPVARTIAEQYVRSRLDGFGRRLGGERMVDKGGEKRATI